jgi:hypothetical protein
MSTVAEIESAIEKLPLNEKMRLLDSLGRTIVHEQTATKVPKAHSVLDIPTVSVGRILQPNFSRTDILGEMLEGRF